MMIIKTLKLPNNILNEYRILFESNYSGYLHRQFAYKLNYQNKTIEDFSKIVKSRILKYKVLIIDGFESSEYSSLFISFFLNSISPLKSISYYKEYYHETLFNSGNASFTSKTNDKCFLHTDSHFEPIVQKYLVLYSKYPDRHGMGKTIVVDGEKIIEYLQLNYIKYYKYLLKYKFPFKVPRLYNSNDINGALINFYSIIEKDKIRYRYDDIISGYKSLGIDIPLEAKKVLDFFELLVNRSEFTSEFLLRKGQILILNNHKMIHGRTAFTDNDRVLYKFRI